MYTVSHQSPFYMTFLKAGHVAMQVWSMIFTFILTNLEIETLHTYNIDNMENMFSNVNSNY